MISHHEFIKVKKSRPINKVKNEPTDAPCVISLGSTFSIEENLLQKPGYDYKFAGDAETQGETFGSAIQMSYVALFLVFSVLVLQFGSFTQPFL